ncbi:MAG TPA: ABC transporter ATP-binding protein [Acidimicrobiales bacterium]|jgi:branched-chain amino acid transport system ATP-binding protein|nr:ABC transporter ATP-binding protein [Acidimicrobiales bacterium]
MTAVIEVDRVTKSFLGAPVIADLSFSVQEGEAVGIVGPNGAGKTTLLNLIAGDLAPERGTIHFDGRDVTRLRPDKRCHAGLARTAQVPRPFDGLSVFENVLVGATFGTHERASGPAKDLAAQALAQADMLDKANVLAGTLGLLDRKRLELARALATEPKVLLLDEIAGGLTEAEVHLLVEKIRQLAAGGVTIVWIEHIVHALLAMVDRIMAMSFGRKIAEGDPHEVMGSPAVREVYLGVGEA